MAKTPSVSDYLAYEIDECKLYLDGKEHKILPEEVDEFSIGCDYGGDHVFPIFTMNIKLDRITFFSLMKNKDTAKMNLKIIYYVYTPQEGEEDDKTRRRVWFNEKFLIKMDDKQFDLMPNQNEELDSISRTFEEKGKDIAPNKEYAVEVYLYNETDLNSAYTVTNRVYSSGDLNTIVAHQLTQAGIKNVLMSPLENKSLTEVLTMPYTLIYNLKFLDSMYGLHSHGTLIFFDIDIKYILNKKPDLTAWRGGENVDVIFVVREDDDDRSFMGGSRLHEDAKGYINVDPTNIGFSSMSDIDNYLHGGKIKSTYTKDLSKKEATTTASTNKLLTKFFHDKYNNPLAHRSKIQEMDDNNLIVTFNLSDTNIHWLRPNKRFTVSYQNPELNRVLGGRAKMLSCFMKFIKQEHYFRNETTVELAMFKK